MCVRLDVGILVDTIGRQSRLFGGLFHAYRLDNSAGIGGLRAVVFLNGVFMGYAIIRLG